MRPLDGVLVVTTGDAIASRFAGRMLAAAGSQVVRVTLTQDQRDTPRERAEAIAYDAGTTVVVCASEMEARDVLRAALDHADVLIDGLAPGRLAALTHDTPGALIALRPDAVLVAVSPFGGSGPRASWQASELTLQATGGFLALSGTPDREPVRVALDQMQLTGGRVAAFSALLGLFGGHRSGGWQFDVSLAEVAASLPPFHIPTYTHTGAIAGRGPAVEPPLDGEHVPTRDGYISFATGNSRPEIFSALFDARELVSERFLTPLGRAQHQHELADIVHNASRTSGKRELFQKAMALGIVSGMVQDLDDLLICEHLAARQALEPVEGVSNVRLPRLGFAVQGFELTPPCAPRRLTAGDTLALLTMHRHEPRKTHGRPDAPLAGITISSFEDFLAAPWGTLQLARFGADVYRLESPSRIQARHWGVYPHNRPGPEYWNQGGYLAQIYRRKRSLAIDLANAEARAAALELLARSDVVVESFRPGVLERIGLPPAVIHERNPGAVILRSTGYGQTGPYASMGAFARTIDAMCGLTHLTGYPDGPPLRANPSYMDMTAAWNNAIGALLGLIARERGASNVTIDHSMYETGVSTVAAALVTRQLGADPPARLGNDDPDSVLEGAFECLDGTYLAVSLRSQRDWEAFAAEVTALGLAPFPAEPPDAREDRVRAVERAVAAGDAEQLEAALQRAGVAAAIAYDTRQVMIDPQLRARGFFEWVATPDEDGDYVRPYPGTPVALLPDGRLPTIERPPAMGQHNRQALHDVAGLDNDTIERLERAGALVTAPTVGAAAPPRPMDLGPALARGALRDVDTAFEETIAMLRAEAFP